MMTVTFSWFLVLIIVTIISVVFLTANLREFNRKIDEQLINGPENGSLRKFSYNIHFENDFPAQIDLKNPFVCDCANLRPCKINDKDACLGCESLVATCTNFPTDTLFLDTTSGQRLIIPANATKQDGYCLTIEKLFNRCNPYHGDLVLVRLNPNELYSGLICLCKNPGFIGNKTLTGACENVFVCDGKIKNLNVPFEQIQCECPYGFRNDTIKSGIPVCRAERIHEHTQFETLYSTSVGVESENLTTVSNLEKTIAQNLPSRLVLNPCRHCILTGKVVDGALVESEDGFQCIAQSNSCIPLRLFPDKRILKGTKGPDAMISIKFTKIIVYGYIESKDYENMVAIFKASDNLEICRILGLIESGESDECYFALKLTNYELSFPGSLGGGVFTNVPVGRCMEHWPTYSCYIKNDWWGGNVIRIDDRTSFRYYSRLVFHPIYFLWDCETWESYCQKFNPIIIDAALANKLRRFVLNKFVHSLDPVAQELKGLFLVYEVDEHRITLVRTNSMDTWQKYRNKLMNV